VTARIISFGGSSVRIDARGALAAEIVEFLYKDLPSYEGPAPHVALKVRAEPELQKLILRVGKAVYYRGDSVGRLASALLGQTLFHLADRSQGGLLLHAAALTCGERCILFPGRTGSGKSTLTTWLMKKGFGYLTDELVYVPSGSQDVQPFARPINIKAAGRTVLAPAILDFEAVMPQLLNSPEVTLVPRSVLGQSDTIVTSQLAMIVFPTFQAKSSFKVEPVSRAQSGIGLMSCLINARNLPEHGFTEVTRLARTVPGYRLEYGDFSQLENWVEDLKTAACGKA
jgi:hypothetical protein